MADNLQPSDLVQVKRQADNATVWVPLSEFVAASTAEGTGIPALYADVITSNVITAEAVMQSDLYRGFTDPNEFDIAGLSVADDVLTVESLVVAEDDAVTNLDFVKRVSETIPVADFTDNTDATGTYEMANTIPAGATVFRVSCSALTGFAGDTSAVITVGDGSDDDRYMTGTPDVFTTAASGLDLGVPSGEVYHDAEATITLIITSDSDFTAVKTDDSGSITVTVYYFI